MVQTIAASSLPSTPYPDRGGASLGRINTGTAFSGAKLATIDYTAGNAILATSGSLPVTPTAGVVTVTLPAGTTPTTIVAPGAAPYTPAVDATNPQSGEYVQAGNSVTITLRSGENPGHITYFGLAGSYPLTRIPTAYVPPPYPDLYGQLNAIGEAVVTYKRSFEGHPSATIAYYALIRDKEAIINTFRNRTPALFYQMGLEVNAPKFKELSLSLYPEGRMVVTIPFTGKYQYLMAQPIKQRPPNVTSRLAQYVPLTDIVSRAGLTLTGTSAQFFIPANAPHNATTTLAGALQEYIRIDNGFQFLSSPNTVEVRTFGQTTQHYLSEADILNEPETSLPGKELIYQGRQLVKVYKNTVLNFDFSQIQQGQGRHTYYDPVQNPSIPPPEIKELRESGLAFDNGGITKEQSFITAISNTELARTKVKWGFAFALSDVYAIASVSGQGTQAIYNSAINPAAFWIPIESTTTTFTYNQYGYLTGITETGTRTCRLKQEQNGETLELAKSRLTASGAVADALTAQIAAYKFNIIAPTEKNTTYELARMDTLFSDTPIDVEVPSYFCLTETTTERSETTAPDPASTTSKPLPPITTGKIFFQQKTVNITSTIQGKEAFDLTTTTQNSEGTGYKQGAKQSITEKKLGKPSPHTWADTATELFTFNLGNTSDTLASQKIKYLLNVQGSDYGDLGDTFSQYGSYANLKPQQGSESYPTPVLQRGVRAAECDLAIVNSQGSEVVNLTVRRNLAYQEGDMLWRKGQLFVIFDISWSEKLSPGRVDCEGMQLTLGRYLRIPVSVLKVPLQV
ncbi:MAG: hypothetical protein KME45_03385 [Stenomitos rutilans HA7619-LM2]|jgi:hypothetical protein|nr:hypothetical protein [Stenomitos rutilans HA7619-LM2]MBW4469428.1 hypothetical protein [Stenomitos rutilans HA7619-LM2]